MSKVLISYRRADTANVAGRVFDKLVAHYGADNVFMDIDNTPLGVDFREHIAEVFGHGEILVVLIGDDWAGLADGSRRIDRPNDMVRIEVETALARKIPVIPVLIDDARMPQPSDLPPSMEPLAYRNAAELDSFRDFHPHMDRLIRAMDRLISPKPAAAVGEGAPPPPKIESPVPAAPPVPAGAAATIPDPASSMQTPDSAIRPASGPETQTDARAPGQVSTGPAVRDSPGPRSLRSTVSDIGARAAAPRPASRSMVDRVLGWALLLVLGLMFLRGVLTILQFIFGSALFSVGMGSVSLPGYYLWQVPLAWLFVALFLAWEIVAGRAILSPAAARDADSSSAFANNLAWPYARFIAMQRAVAASGTRSGGPVMLVFAGFFVTVVLPALLRLLVGDLGAAAYSFYLILRILEVGWTAVLWVMILRIAGWRPAAR